MDAVTTVERRKNQIDVLRILHDLVEIDEPVERGFGADPLIHLVPDLRLGRIPSRVVRFGRPVVSWNDRDADRLQATGLCSPREVLHSRDDLCGRRTTADIVGAHEQDHVRHPGMGQHVALETLDARRAVGRRLQVLTRDRVASDPFVDDRLVCVVVSAAGRIECQTHGDQVFPSIVRIDGRAGAVGNGIAERDDRSWGGGRGHVDGLQPEH